MDIPEDIMGLVRERLQGSAHGFLQMRETVTVRKFASEEDYLAERPYEVSISKEDSHERTLGTSEQVQDQTLRQ